MLRVTWFLQKEKESGHKQRGKESTQLGESKQSKQRYQQGGLHWTHEHYTCSIIIIIIIIIIITIGRFVVGELSIPQIQKKMSSAADHSLFFSYLFFFQILLCYCRSLSIVCTPALHAESQTPSTILKSARHSGLGETDGPGDWTRDRDRGRDRCWRFIRIASVLSERKIGKQRDSEINGDGWSKQ